MQCSIFAHKTPLFWVLLAASCDPEPSKDTDTGQADTSPPSTDADGDGYSSVAMGGDDCDDSDATIHPGATEIPYDGVDQDCDDADLTDVDGDGFASTLVPGGTDCDDAEAMIHPGAAETWYDGVDQDCDGNDCDADVDGHLSTGCGGDDCDDDTPTTWPGAVEIPYDGIDQDCDGEDLLDADGDGHLATVAGGDDCDDSNPSVWPGAPEDKEDGLDNDCDGRVDEYVVCADGSGDFPTIQEGVDGTPDGGVVEICPGRYNEAISIVDRVLSVEGGGSEPGDVVIDARDGVSGFYVEGEGAEVVVRWVGMEGDDHDYRFFTALDFRSVVLEYVDFSNGGDCISGHVLFENSESSSVRSFGSVTSSRLNGCLAPTGGAGLSISYRRYSQDYDSIEIEGNLMTGTTYTSLDLGAAHTFKNNLVVNGWSEIHVDSSPWRGPDLDEGEDNLTIENNTVSDLDSFGLDIYVDFDAHGYVPQVFMLNNILSEITTWSTCSYVPTAPGALWTVEGIDTERWSTFPDGRPTEFSHNVLWSVPGLLFRTVFINDHAWPSDDESTIDTGYSHEMREHSILSDPTFRYEEGRGSYALDEALSPCVDAGSGGADVDGTPNDIGAFGGPGGNWWEDFSWPLP